MLLIEDNDLDARAMSASLRREAGVEIDRCADLASGLDALASGVYDCVLLDLSLPDSEGLVGVDRVMQAAPGCPTVVLTGLDDPAIAVEAVAHGAQDYLVKGSTDPELVGRSIRYAIARFHTEQQLIAAQRQLEAVDTREQIARDMHDTVIQSLFATGMSLQAGIASGEDELRQRARVAVDEIDDAIRSLRRAIFELHEPPATPSLRSAVEELCDSWEDALAVRPDVVSDDLPEADDGCRHALLAAANEALSNISRHTQPVRVSLGLTRVAGDIEMIELRVVHEGPIVEPDGSVENSGRGLDNLRARAEERRGRFSFDVSGDASELVFCVAADLAIG